MDDFERAKRTVVHHGRERRLEWSARGGAAKDTAYQRRRHAIVARLLPKTEPGNRSPILPRGRALGVDDFFWAVRSMDRLELTTATT